MIIEIHSVRNGQNKILVLIANDDQDREVLEEIVKTGDCITIDRTPFRHTISKVSIPMYCRKTT